MKYSSFLSKTKQKRISYISEIGKCVHKMFESANTNDDTYCVSFKCPINNFVAIDNNLRLYVLGSMDEPISIEEIDWFTLVKLHVVFSVKGDIYEHQFEIDENITVDEFQKLLDNVRETIMSALNNIEDEEK